MLFIQATLLVDLYLFQSTRPLQCATSTGHPTGGTTQVSQRCSKVTYSIKWAVIYQLILIIRALCRRRRAFGSTCALPHTHHPIQLWDQKRPTSKLMCLFCLRQLPSKAPPACLNNLSQLRKAPLFSFRKRKMSSCTTTLLSRKVFKSHSSGRFDLCLTVLNFQATL